MVEITCPYCQQKIDTENKELSYKLPINIRCPTCRKLFQLCESGVKPIESEMKIDSIINSTKFLASHY